MRQNSNSRRSRGRGGRKPGNSRNQVFDSNGPGARVRGNSSQVYEKYQQLARDATSSGDRIAAENFYQHAEHYYRLLEASGANRNAQEDSQQRGDNRNQNDNVAQNSNAATNGRTVPNDDAVETGEAVVITEAAAQTAPEPTSEHAPESVAALIEAVEQGSAEQKNMAPAESTNGSDNSEGNVKPARRTRSRRSNESKHGRNVSDKGDEAASPEDDTDPAAEDANPANS